MICQKLTSIFILDIIWPDVYVRFERRIITY